MCKPPCKCYNEGTDRVFHTSWSFMGKSISDGYGPFKADQ